MTSPDVILAFDSGSATLSIAAHARGREHHAEEPHSRSSAQLPRLIARVLSTAQLDWSDVEAVVAARGPGSFTGLRVGLAFALGLHQGLGIPATAVPTLELLAAACPAETPVSAAVNAWGDTWFAQEFTAPPRRAAGEPLQLTVREMATLAGTVVIDSTHDRLPRATIAERSIASSALTLAIDGQVEWDPSTLTQPLYLAPPPVHRARGDHSASSSEAGS